MHPAFRVSTPEGAFSGPGGRGIEITVIDEGGVESDRAVIVVDDRHGTLQIPPVDTELTVEMGYEEIGLAHMGTFKVLEVELVGWPQTMVVHASGVDKGPNSTLKEPRFQDHQQKTTKEIMDTIAKTAGVSAIVDPAIANFVYPYMVQTNESDLNFGTRISKDLDANFTMKNGALIAKKRATGTTAAGAQQATGVTITYGKDIKFYEAVLKAASAFGETQAESNNLDNGEPEIQTPAGTLSLGTPTTVPGLSILPSGVEAPGYVPGVGSGENAYLPWTGPSGSVFRDNRQAPNGAEQAQTRAESQGQAMARMEGEIDVLVIGNPRIMAEIDVTIVGVRAAIDGTWNVKHAQHTIDTNGFETAFHAELKTDGAGGGTGAGTADTANAATSSVDAGISSAAAAAADN